MKGVDIPVSIAGEASGFVTIERSGKEQGQGRIIVHFFNDRSEMVASTLTEDDGYYSYFGLAPGKYFTRVDTAQLSRLGMICNPDSMGFSIEAMLDGDMVEGLDFMLSVITPDLVAEDVVKTRRDTTYIVVYELVEELMTIKEDSWAIQLGAFKVKNNATRFQKKLKEELGKEVEIVMEDGFYKTRILEIKDRKEVDAIIARLHETGHNVFWVIHLKAMQQLVVLKEVTDTVEQVVETVVEDVEDIQPEEAVIKDSIPAVILVAVPEMIMEDTVQAEPVAEKPMISLQAGVFPKLSQAMKAKKRIESKLNLTVEVVQEWDYYRVLVRGFFTVQETYRYYPELVGLGYDRIILIDEREK